MTHAAATEQLRQLAQQKANLQNSIADAQARIAVTDAQISALEKLVASTAPAPEKKSNS